jgi:ubiquinone/menaquinone biosynthesis C-methylase UbiE
LQVVRRRDPHYPCADYNDIVSSWQTTVRCLFTSLKNPVGAAAKALVDEKGSVERFFGAHAGDYAKSSSHAYGADLQALIEALAPMKTEVALDVATGTGFTAAALSPHVAHVTGIDVTGEMLDEARKLARSEGLTNVDFQPGDALHMKFAEASFDIVTTRRATHHFNDVPRFIREAKRVLRPGGRLGVVDMSPPEGAESFSNRIERLRDSSHVEAFTPTAWTTMISAAGFRILSSQVLAESVSFERWLSPVKLGGSEEKAIRGAWASAPTNAKRLLRAETEDDAVKSWIKSRIVLVASKTP